MEPVAIHIMPSQNTSMDLFLFCGGGLSFLLMYCIVLHDEGSSFGKEYFGHFWATFC